MRSLSSTIQACTLYHALFYACQQLHSLQILLPPSTHALLHLSLPLLGYIGLSLQACISMQQWFWLTPDWLYLRIFGNSSPEIADLSLFLQLLFCSALIVTGSAALLHILQQTELALTLLMIGRYWTLLQTCLHVESLCSLWIDLSSRPSFTQLDPSWFSKQKAALLTPIKKHPATAASSSTPEDWPEDIGTSNHSSCR